jgi:hypothetical protein
LSVAPGFEQGQAGWGQIGAIIAQALAQGSSPTDLEETQTDGIGAAQGAFFGRQVWCGGLAMGGQGHDKACQKKGLKSTHGVAFAG